MVVFFICKDSNVDIRKSFVFKVGRLYNLLFKLEFFWEWKKILVIIMLGYSVKVGLLGYCGVYGYLIRRLFFRGLGSLKNIFSLC